MTDKPEPPADISGIKMETIRTPSASPIIAIALLVFVMTVIVLAGELLR